MATGMHDAGMLGSKRQAGLFCYRQRVDIGSIADRSSWLTTVYQHHQCSWQFFRLANLQMSLVKPFNRIQQIGMRLFFLQRQFWNLMQIAANLD